MCVKAPSFEVLGYVDGNIWEVSFVRLYRPYLSMEHALSNLTRTKQVSHRWQSVYTTTAGSMLNGNGSGAVMNFTYSRVGSNDPKFRDKIRKGLNATGNLTVTSESADLLQPCDLHKRRSFTQSGTLIEQYDNTGIFPLLLFADHMSSSVAADNQALKFLHKAIGDRRTSFQGGIFLAELRESLRMITSPAKALRNGLNDFMTLSSKRARGSRANKNKVLAETWLEHQFGWLPLVSDIHEGVKAYVKHTEKVLTNRLTRRGSEKLVTIQKYNQSGNNFMSIPIIETRIASLECSVQYVVGMRFAGQGSSPDVSIFERAGLTLNQFLPTVWEAIPWSFLADYFTNIGDIISAGATNTSDVLWCCRTERKISRLSSTIYPDPAANSKDATVTNVCTGSPGAWVTVKKSIVRTSVPVPSPRFRVEIPGGPIKWINMAALAASSRALSRSLL